MYFKAISIDSINASLLHFKGNNFLYNNINIDLNDLPSSLTNLADECKTNVQNCDYMLENENPSQKYKSNLQEILLITTIPAVEEVSIVPSGQNKSFELSFFHICFQQESLAITLIEM